MVFERGILEAHQVADWVQGEKEPLANTRLMPCPSSWEIFLHCSPWNLVVVTCGSRSWHAMWGMYGKYTRELPRLYFVDSFLYILEFSLGLQNYILVEFAKYTFSLTESRPRSSFPSILTAGKGSSRGKRMDGSSQTRKSYICTTQILFQLAPPFKSQCPNLTKATVTIWLAMLGLALGLG